MTKKTKGRIILLCADLIALSTGYWIGTVSGGGILLKSAIAVVVAVMIIYSGSFIFLSNNYICNYIILRNTLKKSN